MNLEKKLQYLHSELTTISKKHREIVKQANLSILVCRKVLSQMSLHVSTTCFQDEKDEIEFFKTIKSQPLSRLIYFTEIRSFETRYPRTILKKQKKYILRKIRKINNFLDNNIEFVYYSKENRIHYDSFYFTRKNYNPLNITETEIYYRAPEFSTSHDFLLGKVIGFDLFIDYLRTRLDNLEKEEDVSIIRSTEKSTLHWTSSKVALTELIYALHCTGAINSGAADIREIALATEKIFNVELGDYYRTFLEIRSRKINQTKFIDNLKESLIMRMVESDG